MPVRNGASTIGAQLRALSRQDPPFRWELIVVDNGSTDGSIDRTLQWRGLIPSLRVVDASDRPGIPHARNRGLAAARGRLLAFCDSDDVVWPRWLTELQAALEHFDIVGGRIEEESLNPGSLRRIRTTGQERGLPTSHGFLPYAVGANTGVRRHVACQLAGWNEEYTHAGDDIEFCWRASQAGFHVGFAPDAVVSYRFRADSVGLRQQFFRYGVAQVMLYRGFRHSGIPQRSLKRSVMPWLTLARDLGDVFGGGTKRASWNRRFGYRVGHAVGSIRFRTWYP